MDTFLWGTTDKVWQFYVTTIWIVSAIGMACGIGFYWEAVVATALTLFVLSILRSLEQRLIPSPSLVTMQMHLEPGSVVGTLVGQVYDVCIQKGLVVETIQTHQDGSSWVLSITCRLKRMADALQALEEIRVLKGVSESKLDLQDLEWLNRSQRTVKKPT